MRNAKVLLAAFLLVSCAAAVAVPLPPSVHIVPPDATVPKDLAAFSGKWVGSVIGPPRRRDHVLVVEEIIGTSAAVVYALGSGQGIEGTLDPRPFWIRLKGRFEDGALKLFFPSGVTVTYRMLPNGTLDGNQEYKGAVFHAQLSRAKE